MGNSAEDLHALYSEWRERLPTDKTMSIQGALKPETAEGIAEIIRAFGLLSAIDQQLRFLEVRKHRVGVHQRNLAGWARVPLSLREWWATGTHPDKLVTTAMLDQIEGLASFFDGKVLTYDDPDVERLRPLVAQAEALLDDDDEMDPRLKLYLRRMISEIRRALDDADAGLVFDFSGATERLWVAFSAAAEQSKPEAKQFWRDMAGNIVPTVVGGVAVEAAKVALAITTGIGT